MAQARVRKKHLEQRGMIASAASKGARASRPGPDARLFRQGAEEHDEPQDHGDGDENGKRARVWLKVDAGAFVGVPRGRILFLGHGHTCPCPRWENTNELGKWSLGSERSAAWRLSRVHARNVPSPNDGHRTGGRPWTRMRSARRTRKETRSRGRVVRRGLSPRRLVWRENSQGGPRLEDARFLAAIGAGGGERSASWRGH